MFHGIPAFLVIGIILAVLYVFVPMEQTVKNIVKVAAIICAIIGLLQIFGVALS